jgi:hypothetical protein
MTDTNELEHEPCSGLSDLTVGLCVMSANEVILAKFYGVSDLSELVQAQARHIEKLQEKLDPGLIRPTTRVREG